MHDIFIIDYKNNFVDLLERFPHAQTVEPIENRLELYVDIAKKSTTKHSWVIDSRYNYSKFNFDYTPSWHQADQLHVWQDSEPGSGNTCLLNNHELLKQSNTLDRIQNYQHICWHKPTVTLTQIPDIIIWNMEGFNNNLETLKTQFPSARVLRYFGTHFEMVKKSCSYVDTNDFWILSTCCDYNNFDPTWKPGWHEEGNIHCWPSGEQKFGDTFYVNKNNFLSQNDTVDKLEYVDSIHWRETGYKRFLWPVNYVESEDIYTTVKNHKFRCMYEYFVAPGSTLGSTVDPALWEKRSLIAYNRNGHVSLCPRDTLIAISDSLDNYPYIQYHNCKKSKQTPQDVVFMSYDEKDADLNYEILKQKVPTAKRVHGVDGMVNAFKEAARVSDTPWYYAVFARTEIHEDFNFNFNPNYLEQPGSYIFYSHNRITNNVYGHGSVILCHRKIVIDATKWNYDFITSFTHYSIPLISCYNDAKNEWEAWRTGFREVLKLKEQHSVESNFRLHKWLTVGNGTYGKWSILGAHDAMKFDQDLADANDWNWLKAMFEEKKNSIQWPAIPK